MVDQSQVFCTPSEAENSYNSQEVAELHVPPNNPNIVPSNTEMKYVKTSLNAKRKAGENVIISIQSRKIDMSTQTKKVPTP